MPETAVILDRLGGASELAVSGRALADGVRDEPLKVAPLAAAVLRWIGAEEARFAAPPAAPRTTLRVRGRDRLLVVGVLAASAAVALPLT
jgi:hypothetical protein